MKKPVIVIEPEFQETALIRYRDEKEFILSTSDQTVMTQLRRLGYKSYDDDAAAPYLVFKIPKNKVTIRKAGTKKRKQLSESAKAKLRENLKKARMTRAVNAMKAAK